jgi:hypothetical protein
VDVLALPQDPSPVVLQFMVQRSLRKMDTVQCSPGHNLVVRHQPEEEEAMEPTDMHTHPGMVLSVAAEYLGSTIRHSLQTATTEDPCPSSSKVILSCPTKV